MEATLTFVGVLPPPAAGAYVLARADGTGAGLAAYAGVALLVHLVVRHTVGFYVFYHVTFTPEHQGVELDYVIGGIILNYLHVGAGY